MKLNKKITKEQILLWSGENIEDLAEYLAAILNDEFSKEAAKKEISEYNDN
jgi:hypothetical protein